LGENSPKKNYITKLKKEKRKRKAPGICWVEDGVGVYSLIVNPGSSSECYVAGCSCTDTYICPPDRHSFQQKELFLGRAFNKFVCQNEYLQV
jgi:hypothetical protein